MQRPGTIIHSSDWNHWEKRRTRKIKPLYLCLLIIAPFIIFAPIFQSDLLWNPYDQVVRSLFKDLNSWTTIFQPSVFWSENPIALISYQVETLIPLSDALVHRIINILMHSISAVLVYVLLNKMHVSGAFGAAFIFSIHPLVIQTVFIPGYRSLIIIALLILLSIYLSQNKKDSLLAFFLSGITALMSPLAVLIPITLSLQKFSMKRQFKLEHLNSLIPLIIVVLFCSLLAEVFENKFAHIENFAANTQQLEPSLISYKIITYLKTIFFPSSEAFFLNIETSLISKSQFQFNILPYLIFLTGFLLCFTSINEIWGRLVLIGLALSTVLTLFASLQTGFFYDKSPVIDEHFAYLAIIPSIALVKCTLHSIFSYKLNDLKLFWNLIIGLYILILAVHSYQRSTLLGDTSKMWTYFHEQRIESIAPKLALSDYLNELPADPITHRRHIDLLESMLEEIPDNVEKSLLLADLYDQTGQVTNATNQYRKVLLDFDNLSAETVHKIADYFEDKGLLWEARKTRILLD